MNVVRSFKKESGILSVEAGICFPLLISVIILLIYVLQCCGTYTRMHRSLQNTAKVMQAFADLYHEHGLKALEDNMLAELGGITGVFGDSKTADMIRLFINERKVTEKGDDLLYMSTCNRLFVYFYGLENRFSDKYTKIEDVTFKTSEFFNEDENIEFRVTATCVPFIELPIRLSHGIRLTCCLKVRPWIYGEKNTYLIEGGNVWDMDPLVRGKYLRKKNGENLPEFYPVIYKFENGRAECLKSLDHTKKTYAVPEEIYKQLVQYARTLIKFNGTDNDKYSHYEPRINGSDIKVKVLHVIFPTNKMTEAQSQAVMRAFLYAKNNGLEIEMELFQESG